jgi:hypothetical protein
MLKKIAAAFAAVALLGSNAFAGTGAKPSTSDKSSMTVGWASTPRSQLNAGTARPSRQVPVSLRNCYRGRDHGQACKCNVTPEAEKGQVANCP